MNRTSAPVLLFLAGVVGISLSGVMAPGPLTAAAVGMGTRSQYAGAIIALGHGAVEFPLIIVIAAGAGALLKSPRTKTVIGLLGGAFLLIMAGLMLANLRRADPAARNIFTGTPFLAGLVLSVGNPYFLVWWATIGLKLIGDAKGFGTWVLVLFALVHWLCDLAWLGVLSWASFKGSAILGGESQRIVFVACALALLGFGLYFMATAARPLFVQIRTQVPD